MGCFGRGSHVAQSTTGCAAATNWCQAYLVPMYVTVRALCDGREGLRAETRRPPPSKPTRTGSRLLGLLVSLPVVVAPTSFSDKSSLQGALAEWCANATSAEAAHGHISAWDTGAVTDMSSLVHDAHFTKPAQVAVRDHRHYLLRRPRT